MKKILGVQHKTYISPDFCIPVRPVGMCSSRGRSMSGEIVKVGVVLVVRRGIRRRGRGGQVEWRQPRLIAVRVRGRVGGGRGGGRAVAVAAVPASQTRRRSNRRVEERVEPRVGRGGAPRCVAAVNGVQDAGCGRHIVLAEPFPCLLTKGSNLAAHFSFVSGGEMTRTHETKWLH